MFTRCVGGLGRQDRGRQELERVVVVELADRLRVLLGQPPRHLARPALRRPRSCHDGAVGYRATPRSLRPMPRLEVKRQMSADDIAESSAVSWRPPSGPTATTPSATTPGSTWSRVAAHGLRRAGGVGARARPPGGLRPGQPGQRLVGPRARRRPPPPLRGDVDHRAASCCDAAVGDRRPRGRRPRPLVGVRAHRAPTTSWPPRSGCAPGRLLHQMRRPLPIDAPPLD